MVDQERWLRIIGPVASMLKFRLPWRAGKTEYLTGRIFRPIWGPVTTTESRLIVEGGDPGSTAYDHERYEAQMFYHNTITRVALYPHSVVGEGLCHCYDCAAEISILSDYLQRRPGSGGAAFAAEGGALARAVADLSKRISRSLASHRSLADPNSDPDERTRGIKERQWCASYGPSLLRISACRRVLECSNFADCSSSAKSS